METHHLYPQTMARYHHGPKVGPGLTGVQAMGVTLCRPEHGDWL